MTQHRTVCPQEMVMCSNGCGFRFKRHELHFHIHNTCPKRIVTCVYCHKEDEYQIINGDHYDICTDISLPCPNNGCEKKIKQCLMTQHRTVCLHEMVICSNGCGFKHKRNKLCKHLHNTCPKRIVSCPHCQHKGEHKSITGIHLTKCPGYPLPCHNNDHKKKMNPCGKYDRTLFNTIGLYKFFCRTNLGLNPSTNTHYIISDIPCFDSYIS